MFISTKRVVEMMENILFTCGYWIFWTIWNLLGLKWLFRAMIAVIDKADEVDSAKLVRRMSALDKAAEAATC